MTLSGHQALPLVLALMTVPHVGMAQTVAPADGTGTEAQPIGTDTATAAPAPRPVKGHIVLQDENTILVNDMLGSEVYSQAGENIGEISDLIVSLDGGVEGVVIGVGGFLGLGRKRVALEMASLSVRQNEENRMRLVTASSRADLEAAEAFLTRAQLEAAQRSLETRPAENADAQPNTN